MAKTSFASVDAYLAAQPPATRRVLARIRTAIRKVLPKAAEETISYQIPTFKLDGRMVIYFAGWKEHVSLYPATEGVRKALAKELAPFVIAKGTIRFPLSGEIPFELVTRIAKLRVAESQALATAKKKAVPKKKAAPKRR